jgi:thiamine biosynthesis lipoprotein
VNWEHVILDQEKNSVYLPFGNIGLGGIAKGVALDKARKVLFQNGFEDFMIVAGGQVLVHGFNNGKPWRVGIRDPEKEQTDYFAVLELTDTCASTSGNYEKFFIKDDIRYHHIIDPKTGYPARGVQSVTVISQDATLADALSTALFVMGVEDGITLIESVSNAEALFIDENNVIHQSSGFTFSSLF